MPHADAIFSGLGRITTQQEFVVVQSVILCYLRDSSLPVLWVQCICSLCGVSGEAEDADADEGLVELSNREDFAQYRSKLVRMLPSSK